MYYKVPTYVLLGLVLLLAIPQYEASAQKKFDSRSLNKSKRGIQLDEIKDQVELEPLTALDLLSTYLKQNFKSISREEESEVYHLIGQANYKLAQYDLAIENYRKALGEANQAYKSRLKSSIIPNPEIFKNLGIAYLAKDNPKDAIKYLTRYLNRTRRKSQPSIAEGRIILGEAYRKNDQLDRAMEAARLAESILLNSKDSSLLIDNELLLGRIFEQQWTYDSALSRFRSAFDLSEAHNYPKKNNEASEAISRILLIQDNFTEALEFKKGVLAKSIDQNNLTLENSLNLDIAEIYLDNQKEEEAIPYLQQSVNISEKTGDITQNIKARKSLSDVYATQGNYDEALVNYRTYVDLVDKQYKNKQREIELSNEVQQGLFRNQETINLLERDIAINEGRIQLLEKDRALKEVSLSRQKQLIYGLVAFILVILVSAVLLYRNVNQKKIANQLLALKSLRSQMNPHFIFNALNSVNSFISKNDTRKANKYLSEFSKLMRTVMENSQNDFVPLSEEIETLALYLKLEHFRFQDKFSYHFHVPDNLSVDEYQIPPMLIQPYIENAIWHGLRYKEEQGLLNVSITEDETHLIMVIEDNGIGRKKSEALKTNNQKAQKSTGMKNTENRIRLINDTYKSNIHLKLEDLDTGENTGTKVSVMIPKPLIEEKC